MKKWPVVLILLVMALGVWFLIFRTKIPPNPTGTALPGKTVAQQDTAVAKALAAANPKVAAVIASNFAAPTAQTIFYSASPKPSVTPAGKPQPLEFTNLAPDIVLDSVRTAIHTYGSMFNGNPVGNNPEITSQLNGNNPKQANFIRPEVGMRINDQGEMVDPWGTPYFFHQLSGTEMEVHSAGPDKIMWTADDLVTK